MAKRLFIIDLDRTMFDCDEFYIAICKILVKSKVLTKQHLAEVSLLLEDSETNPYLSDLIRRYRLDEEAVVGAVKQLTPNKYLYPDVAEFLSRWQQEEIIIITTGISKYQELKFQASPMLAPYKHRVITAANKGKYLRRRLRVGDDGVKIKGLAERSWYTELTLIDDRNYNLNSLADVRHVKLFHIRRPEEKNRDSDVVSAVTPISNLMEVT